MSQFVKALEKENEYYRYLGQQFPDLSNEKVAAAIFDGPQIRKMFRDDKFAKMMNRKEKNAWNDFKNVCLNFLSNTKSPDYEKIVVEVVKNYEELGCHMSLKLHMKDSHLDIFPYNVGHFSEEHEKRFLQDIKEMERKCQGRWDENMMAEFYWMLYRETKRKRKKRKRNPLHRSFEDKMVRYKHKRES